MAPAFEPSLSRLLAIENDFSNLQDQLHQAAKLAGLPSGWDEAHFKDGGREHGSQHRAEWVLRWLLEKMKEPGSSASWSSKSWILLQRMIQRVPVSNAARDLNSHQILSIVEKVLERMLDVDTDEYSATPDSRKRKRSPSSAGESEDPLATIFSICGEIEWLLFLIRSDTESHDDQTDSVGREHMKAVLRTNTQQAARLLGLWYAALRKCRLVVTGLEDRLRNQGLHAMLSVWESRSLDADDENGWSSSAFVSEALVYGSLLYSEYLLDSTDGGDKTGFIRSFEHLLARHVLIPAHSAFLDSHRSRSTTAGFAIAKVMPFFAPLKIEFERRPPNKRKIPDVRDCLHRHGPGGLLIDFIPKLLELAIDILFAASMKQRTENEGWIEALSTILAECAGLHIPGEPPTSVPMSLNIDTLLHLLKLIKERKQKLRSGLLQRILATYSGLVAVQERDDYYDYSSLGGYHEDGPAIRWGLIEAVLEVDGSIFTRTTGSLNQGNEATTIFGDRLLQTISQTRFPSVDEDWQRQYCDLAWPVANVIELLMQAHATSRDLTGFLNLWYEGLRSCTDDLFTCAWSSERITRFLSSSLEESMTPNQIVGFLETRQRILQTTDPASMPDIIIVDDILQSISRDETIDRALPILRSMRDVLIDDLRSKESIAMWHWRGWRILARIYQLLFEGEDPARAMAIRQDLASSGLLDSICQYIQSITLEDPGPCPVYAFNFLMMASSSMLDIPELWDTAKQQILDSLNPLSAELLEAMLSRSLDGLWPEDACHNLKIPLTLARLHDYMAVIVQFPRVLLVLEFARRVNLFVVLISEAEQWHKTTATPTYALLDASFMETLEALHKNVLTLGCPLLRDDYIQGISNAIEDQIDGSDLAIKLVLRLPPAAIQRRHREALLDKIVDYIGDRIRPERTAGCFPFRTVSAIAASIRLLEASCLTSRLCSDPASVSQLVERFDQVEGAEQDVQLHKVKIDYMAHLKKLLIAVFSQVASDANLERRQRYIQKLIADSVSTYVEYVVEAIQVCAKDPYAETPKVAGRSPKAYQVILSALFSSVEEWSDASDEIRKLAEPISTALINSLPTLFTLLEARRVTVDGPQFSAMFKLLSIVAPLKPDMIKTAEAGKEWRRLLFESLIQQDSQRDVPAVPIEALGCFWHSIPLLESFESCGLLLKRDSDPQLQSKVLSYWEILVMAEKSQLEIANVLKATWLDQPDAVVLELRRVLIKTLKPSKRPLNASKGDIVGSLARLLPMLCEVLRGAPSVGHFCASIAGIQTIIREKGWLVSQYGVDTLLSALIAILFSSTLPSPSKNASVIYLKLCQTTTSIISLRRKKLGGRFHLLLPLLQGLLACLFVPNINTSNAPRSPWLPPHSSPFATEHGTAYTRIVTTLCSPTVSSVSTNRRGAAADLIDETKKAREYAGQFVPQLLAYYCVLQLNGKMAAEVREALRPGIWSMMEIVDIEALRAMSESMERDERAVWGSLYGEWKRLGGGKRTG